MTHWSSRLEVIHIAIESIADSNTKILELRLERDKKIVASKQRFDNTPINWSIHATHGIPSIDYIDDMTSIPNESAIIAELIKY
jgi:hypothetical protein